MVGTASEWDSIANNVYRNKVNNAYSVSPGAHCTKLPEASPLESKENKVYDEVQKPAHYNSGKVEAIEAIEASMSQEEFKGYLKGNALKYLWRYAYKGKPIQDLDKAEWYLARLRAVNTGSPEQVRHPPL